MLILEKLLYFFIRHCEVAVIYRFLEQKTISLRIISHFNYLWKVHHFLKVAAPESLEVIAVSNNQIIPFVDKDCVCRLIDTEDLVIVIVVVVNINFYAASNFAIDLDK